MAKPLKIVRTNESSWERHRKRQIWKMSGFMLVLIVFVGLIVWGISIIADDVSGEDKQKIQGTAIKSEYTEKDALSYVFIDVDEEDFRLADTFTLIKFTPAMKGAIVVTFPGNTYVEQGEKSGTLKDIFALYGDNGVLDAMESMLSYRPHGYAHINEGTLTRIIDAFDGISLTVSEDVVSDNGEHIKYAKGTHRLSGGQVMDILRYKGWSGGEKDCLLMISKIHAALINENCIGGTEKKFIKYYNAVFNTIDGETNISMVVFDKALDGLIYISEQNKGAITKIFPIDGDVVEGKGYVINQTVVDELKLYYKYD